MPMQQSGNSGKAHFEIGFLLICVSIYLAIFNVAIPHGDALRVARQIDANELIWNPNHLLFDPFGYAWHHILHAMGLNLSVLTGFELISGIATIISLYIFHRILLALGVTNRWIRMMATIGLFSSKNFLSMSISQYYFMLQMPFLLGSLYCGVKFHEGIIAEKDSRKFLYAMGLLMAISTGIEINNVVPIAFIGIGLAFASPKGRQIRCTDSLRFLGSAAMIGFPIFFAGYFLSDTTSDFLSWVLAYQGEADSSLTNYYGTRMTVAGIISSAATVVFHLLFGNIIETAGLGTILKVLVLGQPLEFVPDAAKLALAALLMPIVGISMISLLIWAVIRSKENRLVRLNLLWISGYLVFNFFWPYTSDLFWFQLLPFIWILVVLFSGAANYADKPRRAALTPSSAKLSLGCLVIVMLLLLNTSQTVIPLAWADVTGRQAEHSAMLDGVDVEIVPGWDNYKWMMQDRSSAPLEKLLLMNMALKPEDDEQHISRLGKLVATHLDEGARVVVGRLYKLDRESNPWYGLADLGWPRSKIQTLLEDFCHRPIGVIDDVGFHEIYKCDQDAENGR